MQILDQHTLMLWKLFYAGLRFLSLLLDQQVNLQSFYLLGQKLIIQVAESCRPGSQVSSEITGKQLRESFMKIRDDVESRKPAQILKTVVNLFVKLVENIM